MSDHAATWHARALAARDAIIARNAQNGTDMKPCPHCHTTIRHGERYACCSGCGLMFVGGTAFDRHQRAQDDTIVCLAPEGMTDKHGKAVYRPVTKNGQIVWALNTGPSPWAQVTP